MAAPLFHRAVLLFHRAFKWTPLTAREAGAEGVSRNDFLQALGSLRFRGASSLFRLRTELALCFRAPSEDSPARSPGSGVPSHFHPHRHLTQAVARAGTKRSHAGYYILYRYAASCPAGESLDL